MFLTLFYLLRANGLNVSLDEWLTLMEGLHQGLHRCMLSGFYTLCRAIVVTSELDFDRFDQVFSEFFSGVEAEERLPDEFLRWLDHPELSRNDVKVLAQMTKLGEEEIEALFARRLKDQKEEHNGGRKWIGTDGFTAYGNLGQQMEGIRVSGNSQNHSAYRIAGERRYRDWRTDSTLDFRQFQVALRNLRQLTKMIDQPKTELDIHETIRKTCESAGNIQLQYTYPRKNALKLLLLIDSGGSMEPYQQLCSTLFQSVSKAGHFKDLKIFYFHNRLGKLVYKEPTLALSGAVETGWILKNLSSEYRVIFVGDAEMSMQELVGSTRVKERMAGTDWFVQFKKHYPHTIWLHPQERPSGNRYWSQSFQVISELFDMYQMTLAGLQQGIRKLLVNH